MKNEDRIASVVKVLIVLVFLAACVQCERWKWNECRKVGHSWWYCFTEGSK